MPLILRTLSFGLPLLVRWAFQEVSTFRMRFVPSLKFMEQRKF